MLLCSDFDGTLRDPHDKTVLKRNLIAIHRWRNAKHRFAIVTGRSFSVLKQKLPNWDTVVDYVISDNGGAIYCNDGNLLYMASFDRAIMQEVVNLATNQTVPALPVYYGPSRNAMTTDVFTPKGIIKLRLYCDSLESMWSHQTQIDQKGWPVKTLPWPRYGYSPLPNGEPPERYPAFLDVVPATSGKELTIAKLIELENANAGGQLEPVITIGDDYNDLAMLTQYQGYLLSTAAPEVKATYDGPTIDTVAQLVSQLLKP